MPRSSYATTRASWWRLSPCHVLAFVLPSCSPLELLERAVLGPLELYESLVIQPVGFLRRHMPVIGGALVVLMTLHGILLRLCLELVRSIFSRVTYSRDVRLNYRTFWLAMRDRYAFFELRQTDWLAVHKLFGSPLLPATSEDDLWIALQESVALCDDVALRVTRPASTSGTHVTLTAFGREPLQAQRLKYEAMAMDVMQRHHLTDGGHRISRNFYYGILNAETSPGWRIGYVALNAMDGFVDFPLPSLDSLSPLWMTSDSRNTRTTMGAASAAMQTPKSVTVPETYDLESMRWAFEAILLSLGDVNALILDLRFNRGGGSLAAALAVASFFTGPRRSVAFLTDEKVVGSDPRRFTKQRKHYIPHSTSRTLRYSGPLVILQSQYTRGTAEILALSLMRRPKTCRIGARSAGSLTQSRKLRLPNCWTVEIPYLRCFSADGELYEEKGVPVDKEVENMEDILARSRSSGASVPTAMGKPPRDVFDPCIRSAIDHIMNL